MVGVATALNPVGMDGKSISSSGRGQRWMSVKLAYTYAILVLGLSIVIELLVWMLCARTHEPGSGDSQTAND